MRTRSGSARYRVSIHAPVKARQTRGQAALALAVSIHAPVKARPRAWRPVRRLCRFNPRAREGATDVLAEIKRIYDVSIHAPVKARPPFL